MASEKILSARDISSIIRACKSSGVSKLLYGGLTLEFGLEHVIAQNPTTIHYQMPSPSLTDPAIDQSKDTSTPPSEEVLEDLQVTDPSLWEKYRTEG